MSSPAPRQRQVTPRLVLAAVLAVVLALFVAENNERTHVQLLWIDVRAPLWVALLATAALGVVLGYLLQRRR